MNSKKLFLIVCCALAIDLWSMDGSGLFAAIPRERMSRLMVEREQGALIASSVRQLDEDVLIIRRGDEEGEYNCTPEEAACATICLIELLTSGIKYLL